VSGAANSKQASRKPVERRVKVDLGERSYVIRIGSGSLARAGQPIVQATRAKKIVVVTEPGLGRRYAPTLMRSLREAGVTVSRIDVPPGDASKNLRQAGKLYDVLLDRGLDRGAALVALGGGMIGDLTGYIAATYLRGIPFVQVPTTLLSMVDASVGGKVAVNLKQGKNLVGAFHQPRLVWIDTETLRSLPMRERAAGMAELIKHAAIWDEKLFRRLERSVEQALALAPEALPAAIADSCRIKAAVVSQDEREQGVRMLLNFGHTLGHAVEKHYRYKRVLHGEAVAMGMVYAARRSEELALAPSGTADRLEALLLRAGLPTELPRFAREAYLSGLNVDKKKQDRRIRFVVLRRIGAAETRPLLPEEVYPARS